MDTPHQTSLLHDRRVTASAVAVLALLALFLVAQTVDTLKGLRYIGAGMQVGNTVSVSGEGEIFAIPDIAEFSFSVVQEAKTAGEAQDAAAKKMNDAIGLLRDKGIEEKDIKTTGFNVYPRYEYQTRSSTFPVTGERTLVGFEVRQTVSVKVRDTKKAGDVISALGGLSVEEVSGLSFTFDDDDALLAEARTKAIADAKAKAEELADELDVKLVRIVSFSESGAPTPYRYETLSFGKGGAADASVAPELPTGENKIVSNVYITYEIR